MKITTRCDSSACLSLELRPGGGLFLVDSEDSTIVVTADEVRKFAQAVMAGFFDELLGENVAGSD